MTTTARQSLAEAHRMIRGGEAEKATRALEKISPPPESAGARALFQGQAALQSSDLKAATTHFNEVPEDNPLRASWLALVEMRRGKMGDALKSLGEKGPVPYPTILVEFAILLEGAMLSDPGLRPPSDLDLGLMKEMAAGDLTHAPRGKTLTWSALNRAWVTRDHQALLGNAAKLMRKQPTKPDGRYLLIHLLLDCGMVKEAMALSKELNQKYEDIPALLSQQGKVAVRAGDLRLALTSLSKVHVEGPEDHCCHWHLGVAALAARNEAEARKFFHKALTAYFIGNFEECWLPLWNIATSDHFLAHA